MFLLRFTYLVALVVWLGGMLVVGTTVAPAVFEALSTAAPVEGRELAGAVFGLVLGRFHLVSYGCGAVMICALVAMALMGPRPRPFMPRLAIIGIMLACTAAVDVSIGDRLRDLQDSVKGPIASLPDTDARKTAFGRLHGLSSGLMLASAVGGLALLLWEARDRRP